MNYTDLYRAAVISSAVLFVMYVFAPWAYGTLDPDLQSLLSYRGFGAWFEFSELFFWCYFIAVLIGYAGMFMYRKAFRLWFIAITAFGLLMSFTGGVSVITSIEVFIIDTSTLLSGFIIALSLFSPIKDKFY